MNKSNSKPIFTIQKIVNRNPKFPRVYRNAREKLWRLAVTILLAVVGVASLLVFSDNFGSENLEANAATIAEDRKDSFLGGGFEDKFKGGFSGTAKNQYISEQGDSFQQTGGMGILSSTIYNVKDYLKYVMGSIAVFFLIIAATQIVTAGGDEGIEKGKKNLKWSIVALVAVFMIDVMVVTFFEGGGTSAPGKDLLQVAYSEEEAIEKITKEYNGHLNLTELGKWEETKNGIWHRETNLMSDIAKYFQKNARDLFKYIKTLAGSFAILFIFLAGVHMISGGGNEEKIEKEKKYLIHTITAFVTLLILEQMIFGFIYPSDTGEATSGLTTPECVEFINKIETDSVKIKQISNELLATGSEIKSFIRSNPTSEELQAFVESKKGMRFCRSAAELGASGSIQIKAIVKFFESIIGGIAIFFIVLSGISIVSSMGNEDQVTKHKKQIGWGLAGLAVIVLSEVLVNKFFFIVNPLTGAASVNATQGLTTLAGVTNFIATFVGIFSTVSIIIAGIIWVANFGNTEIADKAKKVVIGAIAGVVLSISAYAIVNSITAGNAEGKSGSEINIGISK